MPRVKRGNKRRLKRKKILRRAKGYYLAKSKLYRIAKQQVERSMAFATRDRRAKKGDFRRLWIVRINAAARLHDMSYSALIHGLKIAGVTGIVLTKLDGTAKGGIVVAISRELGLPIRFIGTGEQIDDLVPFDAETYVSSLFD